MADQTLWIKVCMGKMYSMALVLWIIYCTTVKAQEIFGYRGDIGPNYWSRKYSTGCAGLSQSPINIEPSTTQYDSKLTKFTLSNKTPNYRWQFLLGNNGNTAVIELIGNLFISGGNLPSRYKIVQFHFHWGSVDKRGSEHLIGGRASPLEMHIVSYDSVKFDSFKSALGYKNSLAVFSVLFEISPRNNSVLQKITDNLREIKWSNRREKLVLPPMLVESIVPIRQTEYYRYYGSLTTPPCSESVIWTIFQRKLIVSEKQLEMFRQLARVDDTQLADNFRPTQSLNDRLVYRSYKKEKVLSPRSAQSSTSSVSSRDLGVNYLHIFQVSILFFILS